MEKVYELWLEARFERVFKNTEIDHNNFAPKIRC